MDFVVGAALRRNHSNYPDKLGLLPIAHECAPTKIIYFGGEFELSAQRPVRTGYVRLLGIGIRVYRDIQRQFASLTILPTPPPTGRVPYISFIWSQPVSGDDGCAGHIPSPFQKL